MAGLMRQYSWILDLAGVLFCSFFLANISGVYIGKMMEVKRSIGVLKTSEVEQAEKKQVEQTVYKVIVDRNIFDSFDKGAESVAAAGGEGGEGMEGVLPESTGEAVKTSLSINVIGVLVVGDGCDKRSTATISGGGGKDKKGGSGAGVYAVNDEESFAPGTKLTCVHPDRIEFINNGKLEYAEVAADVGDSIFGPPKRDTVAAREEPKEKPKDGREPLVKKEGGGKFSVDQSEIDEALSNLDRLYTDIRAVPNFSGGKAAGMKILSVKDGSLFAKLGLKRGDILQKINGLELDVKSGFAIFNQLKDQKNINLDLIRQGSPTTLDYEIK